MNRHQILTGAVNSGDGCYSVGSVEGIQFTAYAAGCDLVILASDFQRVQIVPGATHGNIQIKCIDCSSDTGKIAASYDQQILVFEPTPLLHHDSTHKLDYQWYQTGTLRCGFHVNTLSWNFEGTRLLVGGSAIQMWSCPDDEHIELEGITLGDQAQKGDGGWKCVWTCNTASNVYHLRFSPDGILFASAGLSDRLVKVWYENKKSQMLRSDLMNSEETSCLNYSFCYIAHPQPVLEFSWRRISKYMPRGTVTNVLMTWCKDNICRMWSETVLPDDGLVDVQQFDLNILQDPKRHTARHKNRFVHKLSHIRHAMHKRRKHKKEGRSRGVRVQALSTPESSHDLHKYWMQQNGLTPVLHFHLAATINPQTDIYPNPIGSTFDGDFVVHWMNNKELQFSVESEQLMNELNAKAVEEEEHGHEGEHSSHRSADSEKRHKRAGGLRQKLNSTSRLSDLESSDLGSANNHPSLAHTVSGASSMGADHDSLLAMYGKMSVDETFDRRIEKMLKDWHNSPDILFAIHPADGSFLVWSVEYLDEIEPGCFRQPQVTFNSRLPNAIPVGDAMSLSVNVMTYSTSSPLEVFNHGGACDSSSNQFSPFDMSQSHIYYLTKHLNGSLNLWKGVFSDDSKYRQLQCVTHTSRACGHRFRTNSAASHPVLPLLITTSHHNLAGKTGGFTPANSPVDDREDNTYDYSNHTPFDITTSLCSELILWRVDAIGPLGIAGGITELAKINSPNIAAFDNVAWLPTLLPSSALGSPACSSPSTLFVASDGVNLRLYQAVIDARGLLTDQHLNSIPNLMRSSLSSASSLDYLDRELPDQIHGYNIVSEQSTSRPGCIIELDILKSGQHDWTSTQLLHVFQGQLITGQQNDGHTDGAFIDLRNLESFTETFFLVVLEKLMEGTTYLHMWEIVISSLQSDDDRQQMETIDMDGSHSDTSSEPMFDKKSGPQFKVDTNKVYGYKLHLPENVEVLYATPAAGHLSSSTIYPACLAPYLFVTACSDGFTRFWCCQPQPDGLSYLWNEWRMVGQEDSAIRIPGRPISVSCAFTGRAAIAYRLGGIISGRDNPKNKYVNLYVAIYECESTGGSEWIQEDLIELKNIFIPDPKAEIDLSCILGTGRKISHVLSSENFFKMQLGSHGQHGHPHATTSHSNISPSQSMSKLPHLPSIPSLSTINSVKKYIAETGNKSGVLTQKHLVQLDWAPTEDGGHILTVGVGSKILFFAPVNAEIADNVQNVMSMVATGSHGLESSNQHPGTTQSTRPVLQKSLSLSVGSVVPVLRWMKLRCLELTTADGLPPLPMHVSWAKDGVLIVGMDNEMHVYSQWQSCHAHEDLPRLSGLPAPAVPSEQPAGLSHPHTVAKDLHHQAKMSTLRISQSVPHLHRLLNSKISDKSAKKESLKRSKDANKSKDSEIPLTSIIKECGLFEATQITNPVLPQYHPKQLLELLNFGKVRRVKAILAHLMHCMTDSQSQQQEEPTFRPRAMSVHQVAQSAGKVHVAEEKTSFVDISSIPPLPLYCLIAVDTDPTYSSAHSGPQASTSNNGATPKQGEDYNTLFSPGYGDSYPKDLDVRLSDDSGDSGDSGDDSEDGEKKPELRGGRSDGYQTKSRFAFGPKECETLSSALIYVRLPGLNNLDQMYLMALADTVAHTNTDFSDRFISNAQDDRSADIDDCGLRYIVAVGHHVYLMKSLPLILRAQYQKTGLPFSDVIWAHHSESETDLVNQLFTTRADPSWNELQLLGVGWFIRNINVLRTTVERIAKTCFTKSKEPLDAAIFYLAMKKKAVMWGLFRSVGNVRMTEFFKNDFTQDRWRKAALKNAYALLGLQRFQHAAAFFLLAGAIKDAVDVCITRLNDIQLAIVVTRLYLADVTESGYPTSVVDLLNREILGGESHDEDQLHPDPFLRSMAYWMSKEYKKSLSTLLIRNAGLTHPLYKEYKERDTVSVFNFYNYLRTHPLLLRQQLAHQADAAKSSVMISGFSAVQTTSDQVVSVNSKLTPTERRLYFHTAHDHMKSGCPSLALEVLTKLPKMANLSSTCEDEINEEEDKIPDETFTSEPPGPAAPQTAASADWGAPVASAPAPSVTVDWGTPSISDPFSALTSLRVADDGPPDFTLSDSDSSSDSEEGGLVMKTIGEREPSVSPIPPTFEPPTRPPLSASTSLQVDPSSAHHPQFVFDVVAQQLKFVACLKIAMEELATLATGFEVDGGHLRYQLYIWLENQVDVLKTLCNYCDSAEEAEATAPSTDAEPTLRRPTIPSATSDTAGSENEPPTTSTVGRANLHEVLLADRMDFEAKLTQMARRRHWLKRNQQLLRTLLTYCSLYGASGGGLACIKLELIILLQELQQEKQSKMLFSPLPFPTTLPLLSASVAPSKTVIVDPISYLQSTVQEMLSSITSIYAIPDFTSDLHQVITVRNLSTALSSCIYECLCDSGSLTVSKQDKQDVGLEGFTHISTSVVYKDSCLMAGGRKKTIPNLDVEIPTSHPSKWPGVTQLISMLMRERDGDAPKLSLLLCEALFAVYSSILIHALTFYETNILYRLAANPCSESMWSTLFGGGVKEMIKPRTTSFTEPLPPSNSTSMNIQRKKLAMKATMAAGVSPAPAKPQVKPTYNERFIPPQMSMVNYLLTKPSSNEVPVGVDYDSEDDDIHDAASDDEKSDDSDSDEEGTNENNEHMDPHSYSWKLIRLAMIKHVRKGMTDFLKVLGYDMQDMPGCSPLLHSLLKNMSAWIDQLAKELRSSDGPPSDYIGGVFKDRTATGPTINKYKSMLSPHNTPFLSNAHAALPCKRLWVYLVHQEHLQELFIKYIFKNNKSQRPTDNPESQNMRAGAIRCAKTEAKILHCDAEIVSAFCINPSHEEQIAVATHREILELDVTTVMNPPSWLDAPCSDSDEDDGFVQASNEGDFVFVSEKRDWSMPGAASRTSYPGNMAQTGTGTSLVMKHHVQDVRKLASHPVFARYLVGSNDGAVRIYEFGHSDPVFEPRQPGVSPRATKLAFNAQGNKFGLTDVEGNLSLYQVGFGGHTSVSYMTIPCHNKTANDFSFISSSSFLATAGHSSEGTNVSLWDTLLPPQSSLISSFRCHEHGSTALLYAPQHQLLLSGGKKGDVCIFDIRQRKPLHTFTVHDGSSVRCMALDPCEEFFVTGSADGDIKVWGLAQHQLIKTYTGEHSKTSMFSRMNAGVLQLHVNNDGYLFSAGADGTLKMRLIGSEPSAYPQVNPPPEQSIGRSVTFSLV